MKRSIKGLTVCTLAGTLLISSFPYNVYAETTAGISTVFQDNVKNNTTYAGVSGMLAGYLSYTADTATITADSSVAEKNKEVVTKSQYDNMAVAKVNDFVYVRKRATTNSKYTGKLYKNCVAKILDQKNGWYQIKSGNATGWVKAEYLKLSETAVKKAGKSMASITTQTLRVREKAKKNSSVLGLVAGGDTFKILDKKQGWVKISTEEGKGWVSTEYVKTSIVFKYGESRKEEKARLAKEAAERKAAEKAAYQARSNSSSTSRTSSSYSIGDSSSYSSNGVAVANYACQFVGGKYRWGGTDINTGVDCSGFVGFVYAAFGIDLPRTSNELHYVGREVSTSEMQPGDIICYEGHVAIYIGNNTIVHASNERDGIKYTSPADYRKIDTVRRIF